MYKPFLPPPKSLEYIQKLLTSCTSLVTTIKVLEALYNRQPSYNSFFHQNQIKSAQGALQQAA